MPDYLSCGGCQSDFELSDILQFIEHKRYNCNVTSTDFATELLECVKCLRKFHTPWPLLLHVQSEHHIAVVRNLVLPSITSSFSRFPNLNTKTAQTQTVKTCLKRLVCPYQANLPAECCLKVEAPSEDSCCCLETSEKLDSSNDMSSSQGTFANTDISGSEKMVSSSDTSASCPCKPNSVSHMSTETISTQNICCSVSNSVNGQCRLSVARTRIESCCDPTQTMLSFPRNSASCAAKNLEKARTTTPCQQKSPSCCPCKPNANPVDQTCQTDFSESFDIDMDLLLDTNDFDAAIEQTFPDDNSHSLIRAPSKAIQTIVNGNNLINYSAPQQPLLPTEMIVETSQPSQVETPSFPPSSITSTDQPPLTLSISQFQRTYSTPRPQLRTQFVYNQEGSNNIENNDTDNSLHVWENQEVTETVVDNSESLLHLLGTSTGITASFTKSLMSQRQGNQIIQPPLPDNENNSLEGLTDGKRKRNIRDYRFNCSECDKVFRQNVHLRKHVMAKHTKQKPHKCTYCRYTTVEKSHLTVHIRTHTGEKPFQCRICNYSTAQNCTLKSHYLRKHPDSKVKCGICGLDFITNHERDKHEKVCRRDDTLPVIESQLPESNVFSKLSVSSDASGTLVDQSV